jgi:hypothetical protein
VRFVTAQFPNDPKFPKFVRLQTAPTFFRCIVSTFNMPQDDALPEIGFAA